MGERRPVYSSQKCLIPIGDTAGWEASLLDHYQTVVASICAKLGNGDGCTGAVDQVVDFRFTYTYDADGNKLTHEEDEDADGTPNIRTTWTHDADGNMLTVENDDDADGTGNRTTYTYDADGNMLAEECDGCEGAFDGTVDYRPLPDLPPVR